MNKIIVLQLNRLGDLVQTVPLLCRLRLTYPNSEITLVCMEGPHTIVRSCGYFNRLISLTNQDVDGLTTLSSETAFHTIPVLMEEYDLLINLTNDLATSILTQRISAKEKRGRIHTQEGEIRMLGDWSKYLFSMVGHRRENLFNLVDIQMGMADLPNVAQVASLPVSLSDSDQSLQLLIAQGFVQGHRLIALQTGASQLHRAWSIENFSELAERWLGLENTDIVLVGDSTEKNRAEVLQKKITRPIIDLVGKTSLPMLTAVMQKCNLLISNDTGTIHIAASVGTRTLGLYFSTAYYSETAPYGEGHCVLQVQIPCAPCHASTICPEQKCREYLTVDAVYTTSKWMLGLAEFVPVPYENLSLYQSYFLTNGSLIYLPVHSQVSEFYLQAFLGRLIWESALGMKTDPQLFSLWKMFCNQSHEIPKIKFDAQGIFEEGLLLSRQLVVEFSSETPMQARIENFHQKLFNLSKELATNSKDNGLIGSFLNFEMMDLDYEPYPQLALTLEKKYSKLLDWSMRIKTATEVLLLP